MSSVATMWGDWKLKQVLIKAMWVSSLGVYL